MAFRTRTYRKKVLCFLGPVTKDFEKGAVAMVIGAAGTLRSQLGNSPGPLSRDPLLFNGF